jgi:hypothetical protein
VQAIAGLVDDLDRLPYHGRLRLPAGDAGRRAPGIGMPSPSPASDLRDEVTHWGCLLEERLRQHLDDLTGYRPPSTRPRLRWIHLRDATRYLVDRRTALLAWDTRVPEADGALDGQAEAEVAGAAALRWRRVLARAAGLDRLVHRLAMPCPRCDVRSLVRHDGREEVRCATCRAQWTEDRYQLLARIYAQLVAQEGVTP